ncbi:MAG TPA: hypothetical protein ENI88_07310 [Desulfobulbus sp.]|nr:hypothetical protein [Desulfobulbus sp.]
MLENIGYSQQSAKSFHTHKMYSAEIVTISSKVENGKVSTSMDRITLQGESTTALTYSSAKTLATDEGGKYGMLQSLVANLLKEQGIETKVLIDDNNEIDITDLTPDEAQALVADDGYFGVQQTSDRIFQFAVGVAGGDPSRIEAIKEGIDGGFQEALDAFGGTLPDISYDTYDAVMKKLDDWVKEAQAAA